MHEVKTFQYQSHQFRSQIINDEPWFVAKDICDVLGLEHITNALAKIPEHHLTVIELQSGGQMREMKAVSEPGLYRLILRSNKPEAEPFIEWVTSEVLPSIRKTGSYAIPGAVHSVNHPAIPNDMMLVLKDQVIEWKDIQIKYLESQIPKKRKAASKISEDEIEEIVSLYAQGYSQANIAKKVGRSSASVSFVVRGAGVAKEVA